MSSQTLYVLIIIPLILFILLLMLVFNLARKYRNERRQNGRIRNELIELNQIITELNVDDDDDEEVIIYERQLIQSTEL